MSTVLITGGASGLGAAVASAVMADGGQAIVLDKASPATHVTDFLPVDLSDSAAAEAATVEAAQRHGLSLIHEMCMRDRVSTAAAR